MGGDSQEPWAYWASWSPAGPRAPPPAPGKKQGPLPFGTAVSSLAPDLLLLCVLPEKCTTDKRNLFCACDDFNQFCLAFKSPGTHSLRTRGCLKDRSRFFFSYHRCLRGPSLKQAGASQASRGHRLHSPRLPGGLGPKALAVLGQAAFPGEAE